MNLIESMIEEMHEEARCLDAFAKTYPDEAKQALKEDAWLLKHAALHLEKVKWANEVSLANLGN